MTDVHHGSPASPDASSAPASRDDAKPLVLVVDDTEGNRYAVTRILKGAGMRVLEAATGQDALRLATERPDLIVLDVHLPDMSGFEVSQQLRADPATAHIPVMHVSASVTGTAERARGLDIGADAYLTHPVEPAMLVATARALLRARAAEQQARQAAGEWSTTFDAIRDAIFLIGGDGRIVRCNRAAALLAGSTCEHTTGLRLGEALTSDGTRAASRQVLERIAAGEGVKGDELAIGGRWFAVSSHPVPGGHRLGARVVAVFTDVTSSHEHRRERELLLEGAEIARADAERASSVKSEFLANMSHELRTPLNALLGYVDLLSLGIAGPVTAQQQEYFGRLRASANHLLGLVNDVLDLGKLEAGQLSVSRDHGFTAPIVDDAIALIHPQAEARGVTLRHEKPQADGEAFVGDEHRVRQVLVNLLGNAVKFTERGGTVTVEADRVDGMDAAPGPGPWIRLCVTDTGIGIAPERLDDIFQPFVQGEIGRTRLQGGTGLGLTISRRLARLMGGELSVESAPGKGSVFTLWLPTPRGHRAPGN